MIVIERSESPLVSAQLLIKNGGEVDPPELAGLADMTANLLTKGTQNRDATRSRRRSRVLAARSTQALVGTLRSQLSA